MGFQNVPDDICPNIELKKQGGKEKVCWVYSGDIQR